MAQQAMKPDMTPEMEDALKAIASRLETDADDRVQKRQVLEKRWIEDLCQIQGVYDKKTLTDLKNSKKSTAFVNQTRPKTNACEARLSDMLFPTDDRNWGIGPTPVPELTESARESVATAEAAAEEANAAMERGDQGAAAKAVEIGQQAAEAASNLQAEIEEAKKRSDLMAAEIDDQLREAHYASEARDAIRDACRLGTGIMKGPIPAADRIRRGWKAVTDNVYKMTFKQDLNRLAFVRVDPWTFFPENDAMSIEESESNFERHMMTKRDLRKLAKMPGFDKEAIRRLITGGPNKTLPTYITELRGVSDELQAPVRDGRYQVWEYRGPLTDEDIKTLCACRASGEVAKAFLEDEIDPLIEVTAVVWVCQGEVLKFGLNHMDSGEGIYSVFNLEKDDASVWGQGIPYLMRDSQKVMNGAWRMMMDNAGLAAGPQIVINQEAVEPADGEWGLTPRKIWRRKSTSTDTRPFEVHEISMHQPELAGIIEMAKQFIDDETSISVLAQGEQGQNVTQTMGGMAILMNAVNVVFRRMVKNFDDDMTVPNISRAYDFLMQFSEKDEIKGDFKVDARGSSVLLVREIQAQNLMLLATQATSHPVLGILLKAAPLLRKAVQSMMIVADEVVVSDEELEQIIKAQAEQEGTDPETMKMQIEQQIAEAENQTRLQIANMDRDTQMMKLAEDRNMKVEDIAAQLEKLRIQSAADFEKKRIETDSKERMFAAEAAIEAVAPQGGGSGGYFSK